MSYESKTTKKTLLANLVLGTDDGNGESTMLELIDLESLYVINDSIIVVKTTTPHPKDFWAGEKIFGHPLSKEQQELIKSFF